MTYKEIIMHTLPAICALLVEPLSGIVDAAFVGRMDTHWLAALAICVGIFSPLGWIFNFLVHGVTAKIGRNLSDRNHVTQIATLSILIALIGGLVMMLLVNLSPAFFIKTIMGADQNLYIISLDYFYMRSWGIPFFLILNATNGILRGCQNIYASFLLFAVTTIINITLSAWFLFGLKWGLFGVGMATSIAFVCGSTVGLFLVWKEFSFKSFLNFSFHLDIIKDFLLKSGDMFLRTFFLISAFTLSKAVATRFGAHVIAGHEILFMMWTTSAYFVDGLAVVATSFGSGFLGRGEIKEWYDFSVKLLKMGFYIGCGFSLSYLFLKTPITSLFTDDPNVLHQIEKAWWIIILCQPFAAVLFVFDGVLFGCEDFLWLRKRMIEGFFLVFLPTILATYYLLPSIALIWWAIFGLGLYRLAGGALRFRQISLENFD